MRRIHSVNRKARRKISNSYPDYVLDYWNCTIVRFDSDFVHLLPAVPFTNMITDLAIERGLFKKLDLSLGLKVVIRHWKKQGIEIFKRPDPIVITLPFEPDPVWDRMKTQWYAAMPAG